jgi:hypothetical protein
LPVIEQLAQGYADDIEFVAVAWRSDIDSTRARAEQLIPSGVVRWGLDEPEAVFAAYEIPYQPWSVLVIGDTEVERWAGARSDAEIRAALDNLLALTG